MSKRPTATSGRSTRRPTTPAPAMSWSTPAHGSSARTRTPTGTTGTGSATTTVATCSDRNPRSGGALPAEGATVACGHPCQVCGRAARGSRPPGLCVRNPAWWWASRWGGCPRLPGYRTGGRPVALLAAVGGVAGLGLGGRRGENRAPEGRDLVLATSRRDERREGRALQRLALLGLVARADGAAQADQRRRRRTMGARAIPLVLALAGGRVHGRVAGTWRGAGGSTRTRVAVPGQGGGQVAGGGGQRHPTGRGYGGECDTGLDGEDLHHHCFDHGRSPGFDGRDETGDPQRRQRRLFAGQLTRPGRGSRCGEQADEHVMVGVRTAADTVEQVLGGVAVKAAAGLNVHLALACVAEPKLVT